jgi:hypothetical protein
MKRRPRPSALVAARQAARRHPVPPWYGALVDITRDPKPAGEDDGSRGQPAPYTSKGRGARPAPVDVAARLKAARRRRAP